MKVRVYNKTLDPKLWDKDLKLNEEVYDSLLKIALDFYKSTDLKGDIQDVLMLGSSVNYNWTPKSDIDLHIVIDMSLEKINPEYTRKFMDALAAKWNNDHNIYVKGHKVEVYLQDLAEENHSIGVYSIINNNWVRKPVKEKVVLDKKKITKKYNQLRGQIENVMTQDDPEKMKALLKSISNYRDCGLDKSGEFGTENIVFKALRHTGVLKKLKDAIPQIYDKLVSVKERQNLYEGTNLFAESDLQVYNKIKELGKFDIDNYIGLRIMRHQLLASLNRLKEKGLVQFNGKTVSIIKESLNEMLKLNDYICGWIDNDGEVQGTTRGTHPHSVAQKRFRVKVGYPYVFWWESPDGNEKEMVEDWLERNFNININKHTFLHRADSSIVYDLHGHSVLDPKDWEKYKT